MDLARRMSSWSVEFLKFNIQYESTRLIKSQCLVDFTSKLQGDHALEEEWWILYVDNFSNPKGARVGIVLKGPNNVMIVKSLHFNFKTTNNQTEYKALTIGLMLAKEVEANKIDFQTDSQFTMGDLIRD